MSTKSIVALGVASALALLAPTKQSLADGPSQNKPAAEAKPAEQVPRVPPHPCVSAKPSKTAVLQQGDKSMTRQDKTGAYASAGDDTCTSFVAEFKVPAEATPPSNFYSDFSITGTVDAAIVAAGDCPEVKGNVAIYEQGADGTLQLKANGELRGDWVKKCTPTETHFCGHPGNYCSLKGGTSVAGKLPSSGARVYRVVVSGKVGALPLPVSAELRRKPLPPH